MMKQFLMSLPEKGEVLHLTWDDLIWEITVQDVIDNGDGTWDIVADPLPEGFSFGYEDPDVYDQQ